MHPCQKHLNPIWLHGNEEEKESVRLLFLELAREMLHPTHADIEPTEIDIRVLTEWLEWMVPRWSENQEILMNCFLEDLMREINSRRERDITLI